MPTDRPTDPASDNPGYTGLAGQDAVMGSTVLSSSKHDGVESGRLSASYIDTPVAGSTVIDLASIEVDAVWQSHRLPGVLRFHYQHISNLPLPFQDPSLLPYFPGTHRASVTSANQRC